MTKLMIAFGSNLNRKQMRFRCPNARPLGKFILHDAQLVFRGVADLEYVKGVDTPCGLWAINREDERALDKFEGVASGAYFKSEEVKIAYAGRPHRTLLYLKNSQAIYPPSRHYAEIIRRGYRDFGLDEKYLDEAIARSYADKSPDDETLSRRRRQRATTLHRELVPLPASPAHLIPVPVVPAPVPRPAAPTPPLSLWERAMQLPGSRDIREEERDAFS